MRLAPAVERPGIHLGLWRDEGDGDPYVWGATRSLPPHCFVLEGDQVKVVDAEGTLSSECPSLLVASQDGHFTVFSCAEPDGLVNAYRVETLLL